MIHEVRGDILLSHAQVIVHAVAPHDQFDQGLALSLCQQWPALARDFHHFCRIGQPKSGDAWVWAGAMSKRVVSLLTNEAPLSSKSTSGPARTEYVDLALRQLRRILESERFANVALPRLATGTGGLDWHVVEPLIAYHLGELNLPIYVYTHYEKGRQAIEPGLSLPRGTKKNPGFSGRRQ